MRLAWILVVLCCCGGARASTSDYGIAAGFAAAAGAAQIAELASRPGPSAGSCNPRTCDGCCDLGNHCVTGEADDACGMGGGVCRDCIVNGRQTCSEGACRPGVAGSGPQGTTTSPLRSYAPPTQTPPQPCGQLVVFCFPGTYSVCTADASGCLLCSCAPSDGVAR